jgi:WD40 repeat protein
MPKEVVGVIGAPREDGKLGYFNQIALSKDGKKLLVGSSVTGEPFALWDLEMMREVHRFSPKPNRGLSGFTLSPDGSIILAWFAHEYMRLFDARSGQEIGTLGGADDVVFDAAFSPDGDLVATSHRDGHNQPCTIRLWDVKDRKEIGQMKGHQHYVYSLAWSPDAKYILTASSDQTARLWDVSKRREVWKLEETGEKASVLAVAYSGNGRLAATVGNPKALTRLWIPENGRLKERLSLTAKEDTRAFHAAAFRGDGALLATSSSEGDLIVWDTRTDLKHCEWKLSKGLYKLVFAPDGRHLVVGVGDGTVFILRLTKE